MNFHLSKFFFSQFITLRFVKLLFKNNCVKEEIRHAEFISASLYTQILKQVQIDGLLQGLILKQAMLRVSTGSTTMFRQAQQPCFDRLNKRVSTGSTT